MSWIQFEEPYHGSSMMTSENARPDRASRHTVQWTARNRSDCGNPPNPKGIRGMEAVKVIAHNARRLFQT
jgi:hypothetical protein